MAIVVGDVAALAAVDEGGPEDVIDDAVAVVVAAVAPAEGRVGVGGLGLAGVEVEVGPQVGVGDVDAVL